MKGGENMSVAPITPQEAEQCCYPVVTPDEVREIINQKIRDLWYLEHEIRIMERDLVDEAFKLCNDDDVKKDQLKNFFKKDWWRRIVLDYESAGWKVKHDFIIKGVPRFVFTKA